MAASKSLSVSQFLGLNNVVWPERAPQGALTVATNVEILDDNAIRSRGGLALVAASASHSAWADSAGNGYFVTAAGALWRYPKAGVKEMLFDGLIPGAHVYYAEAAGAVFLSDGATRLTVRGSAVGRWGMPTPAVPHVVATGGSLPPGRYLAATVFVHEDGSESGSSDLTALEVPAGDGGFTVSQPGWPDDAGIVAARLYMTACNGETLLFIAEFGRDAAVEIIREHHGTRALATFGMQPPSLPSGPMVEHYGRIYAASGPFVEATQPLNYSLRDPMDFLPLDSNATLLASVEAGLVVGTDTSITLFAGSQLREMTARKLADYGAPRQMQGQQARVEALDNAAGKSAAIFTHRGACVVTPSGELLNLTDKAHTFAGAFAASCAIKSAPDARQLLVLLQR